uniref:Uncharacterized protein n=1 Tax=Anguilla anguilla TaxID=7936 RepID=A0A0E9S8G6_ANGAN
MFISCEIFSLTSTFIYLFKRLT